jgi:hypothetical protein
MDTTSASTLVTSLGSTFGSTLITILPIIFGILIVASAVFWCFRRLMGYFHGGRRGN